MTEREDAQSRARRLEGARSQIAFLQRRVRAIWDQECRLAEHRIREQVRAWANRHAIEDGAVSHAAALGEIDALAAAELGALLRRLRGQSIRDLAEQVRDVMDTVLAEFAADSPRPAQPADEPGEAPAAWIAFPLGAPEAARLRLLELASQWLASRANADAISRALDDWRLDLPAPLPPATPPS